jgi:hypothetical protein
MRILGGKIVLCATTQEFTAQLGSGVTQAAKGVILPGSTGWGGAVPTLIVDTSTGASVLSETSSTSGTTVLIQQSVAASSS